MDKREMIEDFCEKAVIGEAAFFIGAGISVPYGLPDFVGLVKELMKGRIDDYSGPINNCPEMVQFVANKCGGVDEVYKKIRKEFDIKYDASKSTYLQSVAQSNIGEIWTTNFDGLIEKALKSLDKLYVVKNSEETFSKGHDSFDKVEVLKIHGDISSDKLVVTKNEYEDFNINQKVAIKRLEHDLLSKSIMFLGYSYKDPNIQNVVNSIRQLLNGKTGAIRHYLLLREEKEANENILQKLWIEDLTRYGIETYLFEDYDELAEILLQISRKSKGKSVYVTGSHKIHEDPLAKALGEALSGKKELTLHFGQSEGYGKIACSSFARALIDKNSSLVNRIRIFPNPYSFCDEWDDKDFLLNELKALRTEMLRKTQVVIAFPGGKGTKEEVEIAIKEGAIVVPVFNGDDSFKDVILSIPEVMERLKKVNPHYAARVENDKVDIDDITKCVERILD